MNQQELNDNLYKAWDNVLAHYKERFESLAMKYNLKLRCGNGIYLIVNAHEVKVTCPKFDKELEKLRMDVSETCELYGIVLDADLVLSWTDANTWPWN